MHINVNLGRSPNNNGGSTTTALIVVTDHNGAFFQDPSLSKKTEIKGLSFRFVDENTAVFVGTTIKSTKESNDNYLIGCKMAIRYALRGVDGHQLRASIWSEILPILGAKFPRRKMNVETVAPGVHPTTVTFNEKFRRFIK